MFIGVTAIESAFTFYDFLEYAIFAIMLVAGIVIIKKSSRITAKIIGTIVAVVGGGCLVWLLGWQIIIRLFLI